MTGQSKELHYSYFSDQYSYIQIRFIYLLQKDKDGNKLHPEVKFFKRLRRAMDACLDDPGHSRYFCGRTLARQRYDDKQLGKGFAHWRRIKNDMPDRYRLFFQFSDAEMVVIFAWLNDQWCVRRNGDFNDVYAVFARLLAGGKIPNQFTELLAQSALMPQQSAE